MPDTDAASMIALIDTVIRAKLDSGAVQSLGSGATNLVHMTLSELRALKKDYQNQLARESSASSGGIINTRLSFQSPTG